MHHVLMIRKGLSFLAECSRMSACSIYSVKRFDSSTAFSRKKKLYIPNFEYVDFQCLFIHIFIHCNCKSLIGLQPAYTKCTVITKTYYTEAILTQETTCNGMAI